MNVLKDMDCYKIPWLTIICFRNIDNKPNHKLEFKLGILGLISTINQSTDNNLKKKIHQIHEPLSLVKPQQCEIRLHGHVVKDPWCAIDRISSWPMAKISLLVMVDLIQWRGSHGI